MINRAMGDRCGTPPLMDLNHYQVLGLDETRAPPLTAREIRAAYHRALLRHHPDKAARTEIENIGGGRGQEIRCPDVDRGSQSKSVVVGHRSISIDRLSLAYQTLSDAKSKADYDRLLLLVSTKTAQTGTEELLEKAHQHPGVDVVDLEDMEYDEESGSWRRDCRCGDRRAFELLEADLEREQSHGEIYVGCKGCSLFIKVLFEVIDDQEEEGSSGST